MKTTNYTNTFIAVADDCKTERAEIPPRKGTEPTLANLQFDLLIDDPYRYTSDDVVFNAYAVKNKISKKDLETVRKQFFSKGQACLRSSPLAKRYGWGIHHDQNGKVAIYALESDEYQQYASAPDIKQTKAMRTKRVNKL